MKFSHILLAILCATIFGMGIVFAKAAIAHFPPILLMALRFTLTALILVWFFPPPIQHLPRIFLLALVGVTIMYSLMFTGLRSIDASMMVLVVQLQVPFAALVAWFVFKDKLGWRRTLGMLLAFAGVGVIAGAPEQQDNLWPVFLVGAGAFAWAVGQIIVKQLGEVGGLRLVAWVGVMGAGQLTVSSWIFESGQRAALMTATPVVWAAVGYLAVVMTVIGYGLWYSLIRRYDINQVVPFLLLEPLTTVLGGVFLLGESLTVARLIGGALVIAGVAAISIDRNPFRRAAQKSSTPG